MGFTLLKELRVLSELIRLFFNDTKKVSVTTPVMLIPGFMFSDIYLVPAMYMLRKKGFNAYGWGLGLNKGYTEEKKRRLIKKIRCMEEVILVGWSMGGVYTRQIAYELPEKVKFGLALGSPFKIEGSFFETAYRTASGRELSKLNDLLQKQREYKIPVIQIYTRKDGVIPWESCISPNYIHKEVESSHMGLPFHKVVLETLKPSP